MAMSLSERRNIIMNFGSAPSIDDVQTIAEALVETLPEELLELAEDIAIEVQDMPEDHLLEDMDVDSPYDLTSCYKSGGEISPGVTKTGADGDDALVLFRRPILDYWCEEGTQFNDILREVMIEEIASHFDFSDEEIEEMTSRHYQGMF